MYIIMTHCTFLARKWRPLTKAQSPTQKTRRCMTWHCADWPCCPPGLKGSWNWLVEPQVDLLFYGIPSFRLLATQFTKIKQREQTSLLLQKYLMIIIRIMVFFTGLKVGEMLTQCYEEYFGMIFLLCDHIVQRLCKSVDYTQSAFEIQIIASCYQRAWRSQNKNLAKRNPRNTKWI